MLCIVQSPSKHGAGYRVRRLSPPYWFPTFSGEDGPSLSTSKQSVPGSPRSRVGRSGCKVVSSSR